MAAESTLRDSLNTSDPNRANAAMQDINMGDLLALVIAGLTPTDAGLVPASNVATLTAQPTAVFQVNATAAASTGIKKLLKGPIVGAGAILPAPGEAVWDGGVKIKFNAADLVTAASITYSKADLSQKASILLRNLGEQDVA